MTLFKSASEQSASLASSINDISSADHVFAWSEALATLCLVTVALGAGLAAAYGRELQAGRSPDRSWWVARLLLLPLLAIGAAAASETFQLSRSTTAFVAAMLSLGGYDCLRLIEAHWRSRVLAIAQAKLGQTDTVSSEPPDDEASHG
jgi:hypothetical protein